jgi:hypothetical protein
MLHHNIGRSTLTIIIYLQYTGKVEEVGDASSILFTGVPNLEGYCPNVQRSGLYSPLLCADIARVPSHYVPLRKSAEAEGNTIDPKEFSLFSFAEFPDEKVNSAEKLEALFGKMKCFNSAVRSVQGGYSGSSRGGGGGGVLPSGWEKKQAGDGREYFVDHSTRTTHWTLPAGSQQQQPPPAPSRQHTAPYLPPASPQMNSSAPNSTRGSDASPPPPPAQSLGRQLPAGWEQKQTPGGRFYYVDHSSKLTQWERPVSSTSDC